MTQDKPAGEQRDVIATATWIIAVATISFAVLVRIHLLDMPLERDEGEFAYMGRLMMQGIPPYKAAYNMKLPGIYAIYAGIMAVFGRNPVGIHIGLLLANVSATALIYALARRLWNKPVPLIAAASYTLLTLGIQVCGTSAHATQFQMPMVLGALILILKALESGKNSQVFLGGLLMGLAVVTKQQALVFAIFGGCYLLWQTVRKQGMTSNGLAVPGAVYSLGVLLPFATTCILMLAFGVFDRFWFWTFTYAHQYTIETPLLFGLKRMLHTNNWVASYMSCMTALAGIGLVAVFLDAKLRKQAIFVVSFLLASYLTVCIGLYFRTHYYIGIMPAMSLAIGLAVAWMMHLVRQSKLPSWTRIIPVLLFVAAAAQLVWLSRNLFFANTGDDASRAIYGCSPFPESVVVADWIREHSVPTDRVAVLGSEPQIYFYADRPAATGYIYTYSLLERQRFARQMQQEMILEIERAKPRYIVYVNVTGSWQFNEDSDPTILYWFARYASKHYRIVGLADIVSKQRTDYTWGEEAADLAPDAPLNLCIFERRSDR